MALESDMVRRLVFFFGFITYSLSSEPDSSMKANDAVPEMAPLDIALDSGESPAHGGSDPTYGVEDNGQGQFSINKSGCTLQ
jgi:hypothetical protein